MGQKGEIAKERMVRAMAEALETGGYAGTGLNDIVDAAKAPKGSIYFHFPGGKEELASAALRVSGMELAEQLREALANAKTSASGIQRIFLAMENRLLESDFSKGCPILTTASETASEVSLVNSTCSEIFQEWISVLDLFFQKHNIPKMRSTELATSILSLLEGAILLSRTNRNTQALKAGLKTAKMILSMENEIV